MALNSAMTIPRAFAFDIRERPEELIAPCRARLDPVFVKRIWDVEFCGNGLLFGNLVCRGTQQRALNNTPPAFALHRGYPLYEIRFMPQKMQQAGQREFAINGFGLSCHAH